MRQNIRLPQRASCWLLAGTLLACCGCNSATEPTTQGSVQPTPAVGSTSGSDTAAAAGQDEVIRQIDEALDYTYNRRRLSVGATSQNQAAWQIVHGVLAFKREFLVQNGDRDLSALEYILSGGKMKGLDLRRGDLLDETTKRYGIATVVAEDKMGQGHVDQWLGYLSDCHLPLDEPIVVEGEQHTIADYIDQAKLDTHKNPTQEYSWTLMALTAYYPTDYQWKSSDGTEWSIEKLVEIELGHNLDGSACGGTHRMTGLTMAFNRHVAAGKPITGEWKKLEDRIKECIEKAKQYQNADGSLSSNYFARPGKSADLAVCMGSAGHVLEFLTTAMDKKQLEQEWVQRAVLDVCKLFRKTKPVDVECGALFHAAHGLVLYREKIRGPRSFAAEPAEKVATAKN